MNKDRSICFRTSIDLRNSLEKIAQKQKRSVSSTIENILSASLQERKALRPAEQERRRFPRRKVDIQARIGGISPYAPVQQGTLLDISLSGLYFSVPGSHLFEITKDPPISPISVAFALPQDKKPLTIQCAARHAHHGDIETYVGASFINADFTSYQALQDYLLN